MRFTVVRSLGLVAVAGLLSSCNPDRPFPTEGDLPALASSSAGTPAAPSSLAASAVSPGQIDLAWRDNSANESGFEVRGSSDGPNGSFTLWSTTPANTTATSFAGLGPSETYCFKVRAFVTKGKQLHYSAFSNASCATLSPAPSAPSGTGAKAVNSTSVGITWTDNSSNEEGFRVERAAGGCAATWVTAGATGANVTSFIDGGRVPDQVVCYRVRAFHGSSSSAPSIEATTVPPTAPTSLTVSRASAMPHRAIDLKWLDNSSAEDVYQIQRAPSAGGPYEAVRYVEVNSTTYRDTGLVSNTTYWYRVRAGRNTGFSDFSNEASATTDPAPAPAVPATPEAATAAPAGSAVATISWTDPSWDEDGFRVERSLDGGASWSVAGSTAIGVTSLYDHGQRSEVELCYRVTAFNAQGDSPPSNVDCTRLPAAPSDARFTTANSFFWKDNSGTETGYQIWYCNEAIGCDHLVSLPANSQSYEPSSVIPSGFYYLFATYDGGMSDEVLFVETSGEGIAWSASTRTNPHRATDIAPRVCVRQSGRDNVIVSLRRGGVSC